MKHTLYFAILSAMSITVVAQETIPLYEGKIPNSKPSPDLEKTDYTNGITIISKISIPTLTIFVPAPDKATGTAVVICPGGGYWVNAFTYEGIDVAKKFNEMGVVAFVLKYRIPDDATMEKREIGPLQDAQQAIKIVRQRAAEWNIDTHKIGIMGFSAGGHLASTAGTHFDSAFIDNPKHISLRPDFMILIYPVISFQDSVTHVGSRDQLIGKKPGAEKVNFYSNELQVTKNTPPTFLVHAGDDDAVNPQNSNDFYQHLHANKVQAELHIYQKGGHGFGLNNATTTDHWMDRCEAWLRSNEWLTKKGIK